MRSNVYSVYDRASGIYDRPFISHSDAAAVRAFSDIASDADHPIGKHPEDFTLYRVGTWEDNNGTIVPQDPEKVIGAHEAYTAARAIRAGTIEAVDPQ